MHFVFQTCVCLSILAFNTQMDLPKKSRKILYVSFLPLISPCRDPIEIVSLSRKREDENSGLCVWCALTWKKALWCLHFVLCGRPFRPVESLHWKGPRVDRVPSSDRRDCPCRGARSPVAGVRLSSEREWVHIKWQVSLSLQHGSGITSSVKLCTSVACVFCRYFHKKHIYLFIDW